MKNSNTKTSLFHRARLLWTLIRLSRNPSKTELVFDLSELLFKMQAYQAATAILEADAGFRNLAKSRKLMPEIHLEKLLKYPDGSLGQVYAKHMLDRGLSPDFYRPVEVSDDKTWSVMWFRQTHDLWHVVTGFDTDAASEIGLQAFTLAMLSMPLAALIVGISLLKVVIVDPSNMGDVISKIVRGVALGQQAGPVFSYKWEENWTKPLAEVRRELGLAGFDRHFVKSVNMQKMPEAIG